MRKTTKMVAVLAAMSVMILGAATMVSAAEKNGWVKEGSDWYYYVDDKAVVNEWALSDSKWYFLGEEGKMEKEEFVLHDSKEKAVVDAGAFGVNDEVYYVGKDGAMVTGWYKIENSRSTPYGSDGKVWYYFGTTGQTYIDEWVLSNDTWYYLDGNGEMEEYDFVGEYYVGKDGAMITGWYKATKDDVFAEDAWVYAGTNGKPVESGWKKVDGNWYYFGVVSNSSAAAFEMSEDVVIDDGVASFHLKKSGAMSTGWIKVDKDVYYYAKSNGKLFQNKVDKISNKYYYFGSNFESVDSGYAYVDGSTVDLAPASVTDAASAQSFADGLTAANAYVVKLGTGTKYSK